MANRVETPHLVQEGLSSVIVHDPKQRVAILIELCDLPRVIKQLQDIQEATNIDHRPDLTGICSVCGNECLNWDSNEL